MQPASEEHGTTATAKMSAAGGSRSLAVQRWCDGYQNVINQVAATYGNARLDLD